MPTSDRRTSDDRSHVRHEEANRSPIPENTALAVDGQPDPTAFEVPQRRFHLNGKFQEAASGETQLGYVALIEQRIIGLASRWFEPVARIVIFIIYFWFGILKAIGLSPATPLAEALTSHTIGMQYFDASFKALAIYECALGILFLIPALTWLSVVLLVIHLGIVSSPLVIVANVAWTHPLVPTLEGQYIIKDLALIALAVGIVARRQLRTEPLRR
jgi:uncharacterized membrane protein YkgB